MALQQIEIQKDGSSALRAPQFIVNKVLAANTPVSVPAPAGARTVFFGATNVFYARYNGTAAIPSVDVNDGSGSEIMPTQRYVAEGQSISLVAPVACIVSLAFYTA